MFKVSSKNMNFPRGDGFLETGIQAEVRCYGTQDIEGHEMFYMIMMGCELMTIVRKPEKTALVLDSAKQQKSLGKSL